MFCSTCKEKMRPLRDSICNFNTEPCCVPCWVCSICNEIIYIHSDHEFDNWFDCYTNDFYTENELSNM